MSQLSPVPIPKAFAPAKGVVVPTHEAQALLAYLMSLKQTPLPGADQMTASASPQAAPAAVAGTTAASYDPAKGKALFSANCAVCHQESGEGLPGAFPPLKGNKAVNDDDASQHIHAVLHGVEGVVIDGVHYDSQMPPFAGSLSDAEIPCSPQAETPPAVAAREMAISTRRRAFVIGCDSIGNRCPCAPAP